MTTPSTSAGPSAAPLHSSKRPKAPPVDTVRFSSSGEIAMAARKAAEETFDRNAAAHLSDMAKGRDRVLNEIRDLPADDPMRRLIDLVEVHLNAQLVLLKDSGRDLAGRVAALEQVSINNATTTANLLLCSDQLVAQMAQFSAPLNDQRTQLSAFAVSVRTLLKEQGQFASSMEDARTAIEAKGFAHLACQLLAPVCCLVVGLSLGAKADSASALVYYGVPILAFALGVGLSWFAFSKTPSRRE